jgi:hypothetical protein
LCEAFAEVTTLAALFTDSLTAGAILYGDEPVMRVSSEARLRDRRDAFEGIVH